MDIRQSLTIDVISDVVCPWCYLGKRRLDAALAQIGDLEVDLRWRPYQLDPEIPAEGVERQAYMMQKFGGDKARVDDIHARLYELGAVEGIAFDFDAIRISPNTFDAHRLIRWADTAGDGVESKLVERLFALYFTEGQDIGDHAVLMRAAKDVGMDEELVGRLLASDADVEEVETDLESASQMGVQGVPAFLFEAKYIVMGAQETDTLVNAIRQIADAKARGEI
ncbi:DsbA family oxidoreductase [Limoniibacter endophyticus]|uniref:DSBA oxidoreductase n=1 Tax=Limoniibacter endophyticus TaxID=1565040 RepID=A0A8J3DFN6_9HYPH|nr:DsbA family oxidoreductase [Limoniibacter endophyticus]GHC61824.1 DSBA oxidoreductase [Limoniibacter endophyticus]